MTVDIPSRTVTWNGSLLAGAAVTITVQATVQPGTLGTTLTSQASLAWDGDADGVNESTGVSDDPGSAGAADPTAVVIGLQPLEYYTVAPCRVLDTRTGTALAAGVVRTFAVAGSCGVPTTAKAVAVNLTAVNVGGAGSVVVYASGLATPGTSNLNFLPGVNRAGNGLIALSAGGAVDAKAMVMGGGTIDLTLDVFGYFQ